MNFRKEVEERIPQRDPFLFVDSFVLKNSDTVVSTWYVSPENYFFKGHFPSEPVVPGVILIEFIAQTALFLLEKSDCKNLLASVKSARFIEKVLPGETINAEVKKIRSGNRINSFSGKIFKGELIVAEAEITAVKEVLC